MQVYNSDNNTGIIYFDFSKAFKHCAIILFAILWDLKQIVDVV